MLRSHITETLGKITCLRYDTYARIYSSLKPACRSDPSLVRVQESEHVVWQEPCESFFLRQRHEEEQKGDPSAKYGGKARSHLSFHAQGARGQGVSLISKPSH